MNLKDLLTESFSPRQENGILKISVAHIVQNIVYSCLWEDWHNIHSHTHTKYTNQFLWSSVSGWWHQGPADRRHAPGRSAHLLEASGHGGERLHHLPGLHALLPVGRQQHRQPGWTTQRSGRGWSLRGCGRGQWHRQKGGRRWVAWKSGLLCLWPVKRYFVVWMVCNCYWAREYCGILLKFFSKATNKTYWRKIEHELRILLILKVLILVTHISISISHTLFTVKVNGSFLFV